MRRAALPGPAPAALSALPACLVLAAALALAACNDDPPQALLPLEILTPADFDPLEDAARVVITVEAPTPITQEVPKPEGGYAMFSIDITLSPGQMREDWAIRLEAYDELGDLIARGRTPPVPVSPQDAPVIMWVGQVGQSAELTSSEVATRALEVPRADAAAAVVTGIGVLIVGGRDADGPSTAAEFYNGYYHRIETAASLVEAQARPQVARLSAIDRPFIIFGGERGPAEAPEPFYSAEVFNTTPGGGNFVRIGVPSDIDTLLLERTGHGAVGADTDVMVLAGGFDAEGTARREVVVLEAQLDTSGDSNAVTLEAQSDFSLLAAREQPALAALEDGDVVVLGGGTAEDPPAERLDLEAREAIPIALTGQNAYLARGARAVRVGEQRVVAAGGRVPDEEGNLVPTAQVAVVRGATTGDPSLEVYDEVLSTPRADATVTLLEGSRLLVAGGSGPDGAPLATADLIEIGDDGVPARVSTIDLARPRSGHAAALLPTGDVLLAGGRSEDGGLTGSLELYTP